MKKTIIICALLFSIALSGCSQKSRDVQILKVKEIAKSEDPLRKKSISSLINNGLIMKSGAFLYGQEFINNVPLKKLKNFPRPDSTIKNEITLVDESSTKKFKINASSLIDIDYWDNQKVVIGTRLANGHSSVSFFNLQNSKIKDIYSTKNQITAISAKPKNKQVLIAVNLSNENDLSGVFAIDVETNKMTEIVKVKAQIRDIEWSPNSNKFVFAQSKLVDASNFTYKDSVKTYNIDNNNFAELMSSYKKDYTSIALSPNGKYLAYIFQGTKSDGSTEFSLGLYDNNNGKIKEFNKKNYEYIGNWAADSKSISVFNDDILNQVFIGSRQ